MHMKLLIGLAILFAALIAGCGGGGAGVTTDPNSLSTTRTLVGFVYVKSPSNPSTAQPDVIVTPASTPPQYYDVPTAGFVSMFVTGGKFLIKPTGSNNQQTFTKDLAAGNDLLVSVATDGSASVTVTGSGISATGAGKTLVMYEESLSDGNANGTTKNMASFPGNPETRLPNRNSIQTIRFSLDGLAPGNPSTSIEAGQSRYLGIAYLDEQGISVPGIPSFGGGVRLSSDSPRIAVNSSQNLIMPATKGQHVGPATVTAEISSPVAVSGSLVFDFSYGAPTSVALYRKNPSGLVRIDLPGVEQIVMRWEVASNPRPSSLPKSVNLVAQVTNKYGAAIPDVQVDWMNPKVNPTTNQWRTGPGGDAFVDAGTLDPKPSSITDLDGFADVMFQTPNAENGPLQGVPGDLDNKDGEGDQSVKGPNKVHAVVHGTEVQNIVDGLFYITRQVQSLKIAEAQTSHHKHVNVTTRVPYTIYGLDVDGWETKDALGAFFRIVNTPGGKKIGDPGEMELQEHLSPTPEARIEGNYVVTGTKPGSATLTAYTKLPDGSDDVVSSPYEIFLWGPPSQIVMVPGPQVPDPERPWEEGKQPSPVLFGLPPSQLVEGHFQPNGDDPPKLVCYLYLASVDRAGALTFIPSGDPGISATWFAPLGWGSGALSGTPVGSGGSQCVILIWGPQPGDNGQLTLQYQGTWTGINKNGDDIPDPTPIPYNIIRKIRINNGGVEPPKA
jgi:hypothetical protein